MNNKILATVFAALVLLGGTVSAQLSCNVPSDPAATCSGAGEIEILSLWALSNSHTELDTSTAYNFEVCCSAGADTLSVAATGCNPTDVGGVISLSHATNAHVEEIDPTTGSPNYGNDICLSGQFGDVVCEYVDIPNYDEASNVDCNSALSDTGYDCIASISGTTNAHIGNCSGATAYDRKICCQHVDPDPDNDGLTNAEEALLGTDPNNDDTDGDTLLDGVEVNGWPMIPYTCSATDCFDLEKKGVPTGETQCNPEALAQVTVTSNPLSTDTDGDGLNDNLEQAGWDIMYKHQTGVNKQDWTQVTVHVLSDPEDPNADLAEEQAQAKPKIVNDLGESAAFTFPTMGDSDCDKNWPTDDGFEIDYGLNPTDFDTDGDGITDGFEIDLWLVAMGYDLTYPELIPEEALLKAVANAKDPNTPAELDITPNTLNLKSRGKWITAFIEPVFGSAKDIEIDTVFLEGVVPAVSNPKYDFVTNESEYLVDHDGDGTLERKVKFDRASVQELLTPSTAELTVSGSLSDGTAFSGTDTIRAIKEGREATGARIKEIAAGLQNAGPGVKAGYLKNIADTLLWWYYSVVPADLTVGESDIVVSDPIEGQEVTIDVTVHNRGETDAGEFSVEFSVDGTQLGIDVLSLDAGSNAVTQFAWIAENGAHDIVIVVDSADAVKELSDENNAASVKVVGKKK